MNTNGTPRNEASVNGASAKDDADWSALRYVLGEMTAEEADAFEQALKSDPAACERVASAARLAGDVYSALAADAETSRTAESRFALPVRPVPSSPARPARGGLWAVVGVAAAICLLIAGGLAWLPRLGDDSSIADSTGTGAGSLVAIWTDGSAAIASETPANGMATDRANGDEAAALADAADDDADLDDDAVLVADDDYNVPGWMIAAVEKGNSLAPGTDVEIREN
jgi:anti-sigma factor RsiW